jgi:hypothetical protein
MQWVEEIEPGGRSGNNSKKDNKENGLIRLAIVRRIIDLERRLHWQAKTYWMCLESLNEINRQFQRFNKQFHTLGEKERYQVNILPND